MVITIKELRKKLKPLGYTVRSKKLSWGRHITYVHVETGEGHVMSVFTPEQLERWTPLHDFLRTIPMNARLVDENGERSYGSKFSGRAEQ